MRRHRRSGYTARGAGHSLKGRGYAGGVAQLAHDLERDVWGWLPHFIDGLRTAQNWSDLIGISPDHLWLCEGTADPMPDQIGSLDLGEVGSPLRERSTGWPRVGVEGPEGNTTDYFDSGATTTLDFDASTSFAMAGYLKLTAVPSGVRGILGFVGPGPRWRMQTSGTGVDGSLLFRGRDGSSNTWIAQVVADHALLLVPYLVWFDRAANEAGIRTPLSSATADISSIGTLSRSGAGSFYMLRENSSGAANIQIAHAIWSGAKAEGMDDEAIVAELSRGLP